MKGLLLLVISLLGLGIVGFFYLIPSKNIVQTARLAEKNVIQSAKKVISTDPIIVAAGDISCDKDEPGYLSCEQKQTADVVEKINPVAVLALGDLQYDGGSYQDFLAFYDKTWGKFKDKTYPILGNHEYVTKNASGYFDYFNGLETLSGRAGERGKGYYSFEIGKWHVIAINSNCWAVGGCTASSPQGKWLLADLAAHPNFCSIAFFHHPVFSSAHHGNTEYMQEFWKILSDHKVDLVLSGHDHDYERFLPKDRFGKNVEKGTVQIVAGTGGDSTYSFENKYEAGIARNNRDFGVLKLTLHEKSYDFEFVPIIGGSFQDKGSRECN